MTKKAMAGLHVGARARFRFVFEVEQDGRSIERTSASFEHD